MDKKVASWAELWCDENAGCITGNQNQKKHIKKLEKHIKK